ncbi:glycosyltransferase [Silvanigrella paludirubra]|uniref:Glycosyltransferase n=1 Tax=Silvanigrella paludirubra TaxID=2499159 RepID=A0A6N6VTI1_9BACT|nr:glycosyltransferase family 1 protein [Silvanigrella paludirubra]KAB8039483.1 glycosyltransferase [Silvanigrella paludirubra]
MNSLNKTIMLDARIVLKNSEHGIARHVRELITNILNISENDKFTFYILINKNSPFLDLKFPKNFKLITLKYGVFSLLSQIELFFIILKYKPDFYHSPQFIVPLLSNVPLIATIHDMNHVALPNNYAFYKKIYYNFFLKKKLLKSESIITVSQFSKSEITKYTGINENKIHVFYNGVFNNFKPLSEFSKEKINSVIFKYNLPQKYIFSIGNHKPHKNLAKLIESYCTGSFQIPLVILTDSNDSLMEIVNQYNYKNKIQFINFIHENDFPIIYCLSKIFIYISLYEGFGLPPIEAAACGIPTIVSNTTSLPEVMGNASIYVDPNNINDIQRGIREALDEQNPNRKAYIENGLTLAKKYSWERMARETIQLYDSLQ